MTLPIPSGPGSGNMETLVCDRGQHELGEVEGFDALMPGSAVYMGQWMKPARERAERPAAALAAQPVWLFSAARPPEPADLSV